jgi:hypothetical protein
LYAGTPETARRSVQILKTIVGKQKFRKPPYEAKNHLKNDFIAGKGFSGIG